MKKTSKIYVSGHQGLVGSAIVRRLIRNGMTNIVTASRTELDLRSQHDVNQWFSEHRPEIVVIAAGTVGGIIANSTRPAEFIYDNIMIHSNIIESSRKSGVAKLLYLSSGCIYPKESLQPLREEFLMSGKMEETNVWYGVAKLAGIKMCQAYRRQYGLDYISAIPATIYGPGDNFDPNNSHVIPGIIHKMYQANKKDDKVIRLWGSGRPRREFLFVDDLADAIFFLLNKYSDEEPINIGIGSDVAVAVLAELIKSRIAPTIEIEFDQTQPDGVPQKLLDSSRINAMGWNHSVSLEDGLRRTIDWYVKRRENGDDVRGFLSSR
jgi:GDP-L-fucose synthase